MKLLNRLVWSMVALLFIVLSILGVKKIYAVDANAGKYDREQNFVFNHRVCTCPNGVLSHGFRCTHPGNDCSHFSPYCFCDPYNIELAERLISPY